MLLVVTVWTTSTQVERDMGLHRWWAAAAGPQAQEPPLSPGQDFSAQGQGPRKRSQGCHEGVGRAVLPLAPSLAQAGA